MRRRRKRCLRQKPRERGNLFPVIANFKSPPWRQGITKGQKIRPRKNKNKSGTKRNRCAEQPRDGRGGGGRVSRSSALALCSSPSSSRSPPRPERSRRPGLPPARGRLLPPLSLARPPRAASRSPPSHSYRHSDPRTLPALKNNKIILLLIISLILIPLPPCFRPASAPRRDGESGSDLPASLSGAAGRVGARGGRAPAPRQDQSSGRAGRESTKREVRKLPHAQAHDFGGEGWGEEKMFKKEE